MSESAFRAAMRNHLKDSFGLHQIESRGTAPGIPDTHIILKGTNNTAWIELKYENEKPRRIDLRKAQVPWHRRYQRQGGLSYIILKVGRYAIYIWEGRHAKELNEGKCDIYSLAIAEFKINGGGWSKFKQFLIDNLKYSK